MRVLYIASFDASRHRGNLLISEPLLYEMGNIQLTVTPKEGLTYWKLVTALWGMRMSVQDHGMYFEWSFSIIITGAGEIGDGRLMEKRSGSVESGTKKDVAATRP